MISFMISLVPPNPLRAIGVRAMLNRANLDGVLTLVDLVQDAVRPASGRMQSHIRLTQRLADPPWFVGQRTRDQFPRSSGHSGRKNLPKRTLRWCCQQDGIT